MEKQELLKKIKLEYSKMLKRDQMIKDVAKIEMKKFDNKGLNKRVLTYIEENAPKYRASFYEIGSLKAIKIISKPINFNYSGMVEISLTFYQGNQFTCERFKKELENWQNSSSETLKKLEYDIKNIDKLVKKYNKLIEEIEVFQKLTSYSFRDNIDYKYSYNHKITIETPQYENIIKL